MPLPKYLRTFVAFAFLLSTSITASSQTIIDQYDSTYTAGISARTLSGYSFYQTFTAGMTGNLSRIDIGFFNYISGTGTIEVYENAGVNGNLLYSGQETLFCPSGGCMLQFPVSCNLVAGNTYTFHFTPGAGIPDPFGVQADFSNSYPGGELFLIDPSGTYPFNMDAVFATYMDSKLTWIDKPELNHNSFYTISASSIIMNENVNGKLYALDGRKLKMEGLRSGIYLLRATSLGKEYLFKVCIR